MRTTASEEFIPGLALIAGKALRTKVLRCGKKVRIRERITAEFSTFFPGEFYRGIGNGTVTKRGRRYAGKAKINVFASLPGYTDRVILDIMGRG